MRSRNAWLLVALFWAAFGLLIGVQVWISMITHGHSVPRLLGYHVLVWEGWLGFTAVVIWLTRRWPIFPLTSRALAVHLLAASAVAVLHGTYWLFMTETIKPFDRMTVGWAQVDLTALLFFRLPFEFAIYFGVLGGAQAAEYYKRYRARELEAANLKASLSSARLHALELQIQSHFLFNTLNSVSALVRMGNNDQAVTMIAGLSDLLRYTLDHAGDRVTLEKEAGMLRRYLEIQRVRFADRLTFGIDIDPAAAHAAVPTLILQPLAENAVRHGIARSAGPGTVNVKAFRQNGDLRIEMFNTGALLDRDEGIGLRNTRERLGQLYAGGHRFELREADGGVIASISIPWVELP